MRVRGNGKPRDRGTGRLGEPENQDTVVQNSPKSRRKYWTTRSSIRLFAYSAHSFACSTRLPLPVRLAALICSLAHSLPSSRGSEWSNGYFCPVFSVLDHRAFFFLPIFHSPLPKIERRGPVDTQLILEACRGHIYV